MHAKELFAQARKQLEIMPDTELATRFGKTSAYISKLRSTTQDLSAGQVVSFITSASNQAGPKIEALLTRIFGNSLANTRMERL